jgi:hypothetical protein
MPPVSFLAGARYCTIWHYLALFGTISHESRAKSNYSHPIPHYSNPNSHYPEPKLNDFIGGDLTVECAGKIVRISFAIGRFSAAIVRISS